MQRRRRIRWLGAVAILAALGAGCRPEGVFPDPGLDPEQVVRIQVESLRTGEGDAGIALAFRFASPANKRATGPLDRFARIVRAPDYRPMLGHRRAEYAEMVVSGERAAQMVRVTANDGSQHEYLFELSRQPSGGFAGCWMTDSVVLVGSSESEALEI